MRKLFTVLILSACTITACGKVQTDTKPEPSSEQTECLKISEQLWSETSCINYNEERESLFNKIQPFADGCTNTAFKRMLEYDREKYNLTVKYDEILSVYDSAFERILTSLKDSKPGKGEVYIWLLYNMGYVVQTSTGSFAVDIYHYRGSELIPYIDFLVCTHNHSDHKWVPMMEDMFSQGKPVVSNWYEPQKGYAYCSSVAKDYVIGDFQIHTFITKHNNSSSNIPVTAAQIDCGIASNNFVLLHSGDSNFIADEFDVTKKIDVYIPRYAPEALTENRVIGEVFEPSYVLLSHILELGHADVSESRWPFDMAITRASKLNCANSYVPFWGERIVWKNNKLSK